MKRLLHHPVEAFRTAPVPISAMIVSLGCVADSINETLEPSSSPTTLIEWGAVAYCAGSVILNAVLARKKIELRDRIEEILESDGFNDRIMAVTTATYCGRQAVRVACENTGYLEEYASLCEERVDQSSLTWLPHI